MLHACVYRCIIVHWQTNELNKLIFSLKLVLGHLYSLIITFFTNLTHFFHHKRIKEFTWWILLNFLLSTVQHTVANLQEKDFQSGNWIITVHFYQPTQHVTCQLKDNENFFAQFFQLFFQLPSFTQEIKWKDFFIIFFANQLLFEQF